jgi:hypothetical protein
MFWFAAAPDERRVSSFLVVLAFPGYGAPFVWAIAEIGWGLFLRRRR